MTDNFIHTVHFATFFNKTNYQVCLHKENDIIVFDDSKTHGAFNDSETEERIVLIVDLLRPDNVPPGRAVGGHTEELDQFVAQFK